MALNRVFPTSGSDAADINTTNTPSLNLVVRSGANSGVGTFQVESTADHGTPDVSQRVMRAIKDATSGSNYGLFNTITSADTIAFRIWFYMNALPTGSSANFFRLLSTSSGIAVTLGMTTAGKVFIANAAGTTVTATGLSGGTSMTTAVLYRIEGYLDNDDTAAAMKLRVIRNSDSFSMADSGNLTGIDGAAANIGSFRIGAAVATSTATFDFEAVVDYDPGASDYLATYTNLVAPTVAGSQGATMLFIDMSASAAAGSDTSVIVNSVSPSTGVVIAPGPSGQIGFYVPNATAPIAYTPTMKGVPSNLTTVGSAITAAKDASTTNISLPRKPSNTPPSNVW